MKKKENQSKIKEQKKIPKYRKNYRAFYVSYNKMLKYVEH